MHDSFLAFSCCAESCNFYYQLCFLHRNMIAWSSFTAQNLERGFLQFYATGEVSVMFDKPIFAAGVASAASANQSCSQAIDVTYSASTTNIMFSIELCDKAKGPCNNPCPDILAPQAMGYSSTAAGTTLDININMQAVSTALAVNLGMIGLNNLIRIPGDTARLELLEDMVSAKTISLITENRTSSYFGKLI